MHCVCVCVCAHEYDYEYFKSTFNTVKADCLREGFAPTLQLMTLGASSKLLHILKKVDSAPAQSAALRFIQTPRDLEKLITRVPNNPSCDLVEHWTPLLEMQSGNEYTDKMNSEHASPSTHKLTSFTYTPSSPTTTTQSTQRNKTKKFRASLRLEIRRLWTKAFHISHLSLWWIFEDFIFAAVGRHWQVHSLQGRPFSRINPNSSLVVNDRREVFTSMEGFLRLPCWNMGQVCQELAAHRMKTITAEGSVTVHSYTEESVWGHKTRRQWWRSTVGLERGSVDTVCEVSGWRDKLTMSDWILTILFPLQKDPWVNILQYTVIMLDYLLSMYEPQESL